MSDPKQIKNWFNRALDVAAALREARETFNEMKTEDAEAKMDWARLRQLAVARDADLHDEKKHDRVEKLLEKGTYASWYADIVGIGKNEQNDQPRSSSGEERSGLTLGPTRRSAPRATVGDDRGDGDPVANQSNESRGGMGSDRSNDRELQNDCGPIDRRNADMTGLSAPPVTSPLRGRQDSVPIRRKDSIAQDAGVASGPRDTHSLASAIDPAPKPQRDSSAAGGASSGATPPAPIPESEPCSNDSADFSKVNQVSAAGSNATGLRGLAGDPIPEPMRREPDAPVWQALRGQ